MQAYQDELWEKRILENKENKTSKKKKTPVNKYIDHIFNLPGLSGLE